MDGVINHERQLSKLMEKLISKLLENLLQTMEWVTECPHRIDSASTSKLIGICVEALDSVICCVGWEGGFKYPVGISSRYIDLSLRVVSH